MPAWWRYYCVKAARLNVRRPSKYGNKRYQLDGISFMSKAEAAYYWFYLKQRHEADEIQNLEFQPRIRCEIEGEKICDYIADFAYFDRQEEGRHGQHGCHVIIEVKGYKTDVYKLKMKLVHALHRASKIIVIPASSLRKEIAQLPPQEGKPGEED